MILVFFNFLKGYLIIKVNGFSVERFINLAMNRNIYLSDIKYCKNYVTMKVSINGFKMLKPIAKKTKCKIQILDKKGLPFIVFKYRKRKILALGVLFFVFSIYILSSRVWLIEYQGLDRIDYNTFESFLEKDGLYISGVKNKIDKEKIKENIMRNFEDVAWINIDIKGTKAVVSVKETIVKNDKKNDDLDENITPTNIISKKHGIIDTIVVSKGSAKVKPLDVVKKGDILIEGILVVKEDEFGVMKSYVESSGEVLAKTYYNFSFTVPFEYEQKEYSNEKIVDRRYKIFDKNYEILKPNVLYTNYTRTSSYKNLSLGQDYPLPFTIIKDTYSEFSTTLKTRSLEEATTLAYKIVDSKILHELAFDVNIVDKKIELSENKNGIVVTVFVDAIENIGETIDIDMNEIQDEIKKELQSLDQNNINSND